MKRFKKLTAWVLTLAMLMAFIPAFSLTASSEEPVPNVTSIDFNRDSEAYDEETNTFYVTDSKPFILTVTGENLTQFNEMGGLEALFKGETESSGWVITTINIYSDTEATISIGTSSLTYILNNSFGSTKTTAVMVENNGTQYGSTIYVGIKHAPTRQIRIECSAGGTVEHDNLFSNYIAVGETVNLTIIPDSGYELESLTVDGIDVTEQVSGDTYTFTMPDKILEVEATFSAIPTADIKVEAVDMANGAKLSGAHMQILDEAGDVTEEWVSSSETKTVENLELDVPYTLHTTVAPDGYIIPEDTVFSVDEDGDLVTVGDVSEDGTLLAVFANTVVKFSAVNTDNSEKLSGARLQILDEEDVIEEWESDAEVKTIKGLKTGVPYTLHVAESPDGYETPEDAQFAVDESGNVSYACSTTVEDGSVVLLVEFEPISTYTVTFVDWDDAVLGTDTVEQGMAATAPANPVRTGWKFTGWDKDFDNVTSDLTVKAEYVKKNRDIIHSGGGTTTYTVKFETNGGNTITDKTVVRNNKLAKPTAPVKDGFTFEGWYTDEELTTAYDFDSKVTGNFTLYAKWEKEDDNQGASGHDCPSLKFNDLDITQWYHLDTDYVIGNDIFKGTAEKTFTPHGNITRAMMITVLYRAEGEPEVSGKATFEDVNGDAYYAKAVLWGQQNGIIKGYSDAEYAPEQPIAREQIAAVMYRYAKYLGIDVGVGENTNILSYEDFDKISEYAIPAMQWAVGSGMIKGRSESTLNPQDFAERVEIAAMLHRFIETNK